MRLFKSILLFFFLSSLCMGQKTGIKNFHVQGRFINDKPAIKIIPGNPAAWFLGMKNGYSISLQREGGEYSVLSSDLRPAPESEFATLDVEYAAVMSRMIYEENYAAPGGSFDDMVAADKNMSRLYFSYLLFSSYDPDLSKMSGLQLNLPDEELPPDFQIKISINNHPSYTSEHRLVRSHFYTDLESPNFTVEAGDKEADIFLNHRDYDKLFVAYLVERSEDGINFERRGSPRIFNAISEEGRNGLLTVHDSLPGNYKQFSYRVRGFDAFGYLSNPNDPQTISGKDLTPPPAPVNLRIEEKNGEIQIGWNLLVVPEDLDGFQIIGSQSEKGQYNLLHPKLLPPTQRSYSFTQTSGLFRYYRILAVDTARNAKASDLLYLVVYDTIPPEPPVEVKAKVDSNYIATISWAASPEEDLKGYRVFKAYHPTNGFQPLTPKPIYTTSYSDTLSGDRLDKRVFYQIVALDTHFNHSEPSEYAAAAIPDTLPPTRPLLMQANLNQLFQAELSWNPSSSRDVARYLVLRQLNTDSVKLPLEELSSSVNTFRDESLEAVDASSVTYFVVAIDSSENASPISNGKRILIPRKEKSDKASLNAEAEENQVQLSWTGVSREVSVLIYRAVGDKNFTLLDRISGENTYFDTKVSKGNTYSYRIGTLDKKGKRGELSQEVDVQLN